MMHVICTYIFITIVAGQEYRVPKNIPGIVLNIDAGYSDEGAELWQVDFGYYFQSGYMLKNFRNEFNTHVKHVNANSCLIAD